MSKILYITKGAAGMSLEEKRAWIRMLAGVAAYIAYVVVVLTRADGRPLTGVPYEAPLLWSIVAAIVASIVIEIVVNTVRRGSLVTDERDRAIGRLGDQVGYAFVVIGAVAAMLMAMADWHRFWIANVIYLCFALSMLLGSIAKIAAYRGSLPQW
ncbi:hypothetical protein [Virgisporangium ochraceum]|nr:hypothetical protein [Virgisporangium ochraceum]